MKTFATQALIDELQRMLRRQLEQLAFYRAMDIEMLAQRPAADRWSIIEICEHLNLSSGHYYKLLRKIYNDPNSRLRLNDHFAPGRFGDLSAKAMQPLPDGKINWKMKTLGMFEPRTAAGKGIRSMDELRSMLEGMIDLLEVARTRGLEGEKVTSTLGPLLRFKAGDAFRFPVAHQERHFRQMQRTLEQIKKKSSAAA